MSPPNQQRRTRVEWSDRGVGLVEVMISVALLGIVVVAVVSAVRTTVVSADTDNELALARSVLQAASDEIVLDDYVDCASSGDFTDALTGVSVPNGWGLAVDSVEYLSRTDGVEVWGSTCAAADPNSPVYPQRVTLTVASNGRIGDRSITVIKGRS